LRSRRRSLGFSIDQRVTTGVATINAKEPEMITNQPMPATQNESWGFWAPMENNARAAWPLAMTAIADATGEPLESVQAFLDSRHGRHFADDVRNQLLAGQDLENAIDAATQQWMTWTIGRQISKDYGIPRGMPYLTGFVVHCAMVDEESPAN
jgi:hypothetical protein